MKNSQELSERCWPSVKPGTPSLWPPDRRRTPGLWRWAARQEFCRCQRSSPCLVAAVLAGTPSGSLWRQTPPGRIEDLWRDGVVVTFRERWALTRCLQHTHRPAYKLPAGWWCFCACLSSSSSPSLTPGLTGLYLLHHLRTEKEAWLEKICFIWRGTNMESWCDAAQMFLTFQHLCSNSQWLVGLLLIDADGLSHDYLTEAALP